MFKYRESKGLNSVKIGQKIVYNYAIKTKRSQCWSVSISY